MDLGLGGKVAIVTGGGAGIGRAESVALAREGVSVVMADVDPAAAAAAAEVRALGVAARWVRTDVSDPQSVGDMVAAVQAELGRIDILVNNAGVFGRHLGPAIADLPVESWDTMLAVHLRGTFLCTRAVAPHMLRAGWGRIINTSSIHAASGARTGFAAYTAAKGGIEAFTRTAARELGPGGVTVNAVAPGFVRTAALAWSPAQYRAVAAQVPVGRLAEPADIANCVVFLASQQACYVNGAVLDVNGGRTDYVVEA